jgi:hypothetical protein
MTPQPDVATMSAERSAELRRTVEHRRDGGWVHATMIELLDAVDAVSEERVALVALIRWLGVQHREHGLDIELPLPLHAQLRRALGDDFYVEVTDASAA